MRIVVVTLTVLVLGLIGYSQLTRQKKQNVQATDPVLASSSRPDSRASSERGQEHRPEAFTRINPPNERSHDEEQFFNPELMRDPTYVARVMKHIDLSYYYASPAKETRECEEIRILLEREGLGVDAVGDAYNAAYDHARHLAVGRKNGKEAQMELVAKMSRDNAEYRLRTKYGITNSAFFDALFRLEPQVFFGTKNRALPQPGERLLD